MARNDAIRMFVLAAAALVPPRGVPGEEIPPAAEPPAAERVARLGSRGVRVLSMHFYDGSRRGASTLAIRPLRWEADGWPVVER